ncbi:TonB-dependent receptor plug domain-containing protein [Maricaulis maris]|uniref:Vitamin B12 transporter n=1 Tax=Maricaulis maris TaxID=74318 RepID=A0A495DL93_9PROT|nr:TonB-dependent receptor [Maricaulis maris]RKR03706.1 vitamin B12 transporter [Maricaulis maris]
MRIKNWHRLCLAATCLSLPGQVLAQDIGDEDVVYVTAARIALPADQATSSVTLLDAAMLEARGAPFAADALRAVPGLAVSRSGAPGSLTQIRARGAEANHVLVLIDGVEASNPFTGEADFSHYVFDDLASIEVARGEQSALWGADAIGGVIRLNSVRPDSDFNVGLRLEAGSFDTRRISLQAGGELGDHWLTGSFSDYASDGIDVSGLGGETDGYDNTVLALSGGYRFNEAVRLEATLRRIESGSDYDSDTDFDGRLDNVDLHTDSETVLARVAVLAEQSVGSVRLSHEAAVQLTDDTSQSLSAGVRTSRSLGQRLQAHYQLTGHWETGPFQHRLTGLIERDQDRLKADAGPAAGSNQSRQLEADAIAFDYGISRGALDLTASARRDVHTLFADSTTWRVGAGWAFDRLDGRLRANFGEAVKNPGVYELFGFFPDFFVGNPDLEPEQSKGWEIAWDQTLLDGAASLSVSYFRSELENEIYTDFSAFPSTALNSGTQSDRSGVEISGIWEIDADWSLFGSLSLLESEENGVAEIRRPEQLASLTISWAPADGPVSASATLDHTGDQTDTDFGTFQPVVLDAYTLVGGQVSWDVRPGIEVYARGGNLLDEEYQDVFGYHTPGRGLHVGLRLSHR